MYENDSEAFEVAKHVWIRNWINRLGDTPEAWIEIPEARINHAPNPTGRAVLCWSTFVDHFNGVFCFVPFTAAFKDYVDHTRMHVSPWTLAGGCLRLRLHRTDTPRDPPNLHHVPWTPAAVSSAAAAIDGAGYQRGTDLITLSMIHGERSR